MDEERDELIERVATELRRPVALSPGFDARLMARISAEPRPGSLVAIWAALRRPRPVMVSPLGVLALAAGVATLVLGAAVFSSLRLEGPGGPAAAAPAAPAAPHPVQFVLVMPGARSVSLVGDFNDWQVGAVPLERASGNGVWTVTVPLEPGRYRYTFFVDGRRWVADPSAPRAPEDDFGVPNSVITVGEHGT